MVARKCRSKIFPCPAGERCPEHRVLLNLIADKNYEEALKIIFLMKQPIQDRSNLALIKISNIFEEVEPHPPKSKEAISLRNGIFLAASRTYGETYIEPVIRNIYSLLPANSNEFDAISIDGELKYEIKTAKVLKSRDYKKRNGQDLFTLVTDEEKSSALSRMVDFKDRKTARYDANIQNVKRTHFDYLIYSLVYSDGIQIFKIGNDKINKDSISNWSDKHGRYDAIGKSGQFTVKRGNIIKHEELYGEKFFTWEELVPLYKGLDEKDSQ